MHEPNIVFVIVPFFVLLSSSFFNSFQRQLSASPGAAIQKINSFLSSYTQPEGNLDLALTWGLGFILFFPLIYIFFSFGRLYNSHTPRTTDCVHYFMGFMGHGTSNMGIWMDHGSLGDMTWVLDLGFFFFSELTCVSFFLFSLLILLWMNSPATLRLSLPPVCSDYGYFLTFFPRCHTFLFLTFFQISFCLVSSLSFLVPRS